MFAREDHKKVKYPTLPDSLSHVFQPGQMYRHQEAVPPLPLPSLQQTLKKYLLTVEPLLSAAELAETRKVVEEFGRPGGVGEGLHRKLEKRAETRPNWLIEWWIDYAYLGCRIPVIINITPVSSYPLLSCTSVDEHARLATKFILVRAKLIQLMYHEAIPVEKMRGKHLCMTHYRQLFGNRIPGPRADSNRFNFIPEERHIVLIRKGHMFQLDLFYDTPEGEMVVAPPTHVMNELHKILTDMVEECPYPVGVLTTEHRDTWYQARKRLSEDSVNRASLDVLDRALFIVCLDKPLPHVTPAATGNTPFNSVPHTTLAGRCLHGNGTKFNTCNRWFDAATQVVVGGDGGCGMILEHSTADAIPAMNMDNFAFDILNSDDQSSVLLQEASPVSMSQTTSAKRLLWNVNSDTVRDIETAKHNIDRLIQDTDLQVFIFTDFGKDFPKSAKVSPDGYMQNAMQLAYYKLYGTPVSTYESGSTRQFKQARTEVIRSCSNTSHFFLKTMSNPLATCEAKASSIVASINAHSEYIKDALSGHGVDRHLLGLRMLAKESGMEMPPIFTDVAYTRSTHWLLSTSQVPSVHDMFMCFGSETHDGYGICYNLQEKKLIFTVSSWKSCPNTSSLVFGDKIAESLLEMRTVLTNAKKLSPKL